MLRSTRIIINIPIKNQTGIKDITFKDIPPKSPDSFYLGAYVRNFKNKLFISGIRKHWMES